MKIIARLVIKQDFLFSQYVFTEYLLFSRHSSRLSVEQYAKHVCPSRAYVLTLRVFYVNTLGSWTLRCLINFPFLPRAQNFLAGRVGKSALFLMCIGSRKPEAVPERTKLIMDEVLSVPFSPGSGSPWAGYQRPHLLLPASTTLLWQHFCGCVGPQTGHSWGRCSCPSCLPDSHYPAWAKGDAEASVVPGKEMGSFQLPAKHIYIKDHWASGQ